MCILVVEDEAIIAMVVEDAFQNAGHEVMTVGRVSGAMDLLAKYPGRFTCLVTDLHMPGTLNGIDLVEHMRQNYPAIPMIMTTGRPDAATPEWRKRHRVELLSKPYSPEHLVEAVEGLLQAIAPTRQPFWNARLVRLEGEVARERTFPRWQNPYVFGKAEHDAWADGWDKRDRELG